MIPVEPLQYQPASQSPIHFPGGRSGVRGFVLWPGDQSGNQFTPAWLATPLLQPSAVPCGLHRLPPDRHSMNRYGQADEIAAMVAYPVSPEAGFVTGSSLTIDGGFLV